MEIWKLNLIFHCVLEKVRIFKGAIISQNVHIEENKVFKDCSGEKQLPGLKQLLYQQKPLNLTIDGGR